MKNQVLPSRDFKRSLRNSQFLGWVALLAALFLCAVAADAKEVVQTSFLYTLSNFNGPLLSQMANIYVDRGKNDIYVYDPQKRDIRIFNESGMEVYVFGDDGSFGTVSDLTVDRIGNIILISRMRSIPDILLCDYRGELKSKIELQNLPPEFSRFKPNRIRYWEGKLYLLQSDALRLAVTDMNGVFESGYDIASILDIDDKNRSDNEITGFSVDKEGNMLFTIAVLFQAYRISPDGRPEAFGKSGSGPGSFGVVAGITSDKRGNIYVSDRLRCVVLVFDKNLGFLTEFGYRGGGPGNLIVPDDIDFDNEGKLYVAQGGSAGVSVFEMTYRQN